MTIQNLWDAAKSVLRGKFTVIEACFKKQDKSTIINLILHLKQLEEEENKTQSWEKERNHKDQIRNK